MKAFKWLYKLFTGQFVLIHKTELFFYKQLEEKEKSLLTDIYNLVCKSDKIDGIETKARYEFGYDLAEMMFKSTRDGKERFADFCGYFKYIETDSAKSAE